MSNPYDLKIVFNADAKRLLATQQKVLAQQKEINAEVSGLKKSGSSATGAVNSGAKKSNKSLGAMFVTLLRLRAGFVVIGLVAMQAFDIIVGGAVKAQQEMLKAHAASQKLVAEIQTLTLNDQASYQMALTRELRDLSVEFGQTFDTMAKAKYDIISAGFTGVTESIELLRVSAMGAVAGVTDVGTFAKFLASSLRGYGEDASKAADYSDILFTTVQRGVTTIPELANALGRVTPLANSAGVSFAELGALIATLTAKGLKTQEATTAARALFSQLVGGSKETRDRLRDLGITIRGGLVPALKAVSEAGGDDSEFLREIFGNVRAYTAAASAGADGARLLSENLDHVANRADNAKSAYEIVAETIAIQSARIEAALANIDQAGGEAYGQEFLKRSDSMIKSLQAMEGAANRASITVAPAMARFNEHWTLLKANAKICGTYLSVIFMEILSRLVQGLKWLAKALRDVNDWYVQLISNLPGAEGALDGVTEAADRQTESMEGLSEASRIAAEDMARAFTAGAAGSGFRVFTEKMDRLKKSFDDGLTPANRYKELFDKFTGTFLASANAMEKLAYITLAGAAGFESLELDKVVETMILNINKDNIARAAEGLGAQMSDLIVTGAGYRFEVSGVTVLTSRLTKLVNDVIAEVGKANESGAGIDLDILRIVNTDFDDDEAISALRVYLDSLRAEAAEYGGKTGRDWRKTFVSKASAVARDLSVEFGESFALVDDASVQAAIDSMREKLVRHGYGDVMDELAELYGIDMTKIVDEEDSNAALDLFRETIQQARRIAREGLDAMRSDVDIVGEVLEELRARVDDSMLPTLEKLELALDLSSSAEETKQIIMEIVNLMISLGYVSEEILQSEFWDTMMRRLNDVREGMTSLREDAEKLVDRVASEVAGAFSQAGQQAVEMWVTGERHAIMLGDTIRRVLVAAIMDYIAKLIIAEAIQKALFAAFGMEGGGTVPAYKNGGIVAPMRAAMGMVVPNMVGSQAGMDSVHILAQPGEGVVKRHDMQRLSNMLSAFEQGKMFGGASPAMAGGGTTNVWQFNVSRPQSRSDSEDMVRTVEDMSRTAERREY